jgi:hypothetical protein
VAFGHGHPLVIIIAGCKNYIRKVYTFQKKDSKVGLIEMVQEA